MLEAVLFEALKSIHDSYSRFVTIHGTHEAIVKDVVGYNCNGHGFFLEDGYETENKERFLIDKYQETFDWLGYEKFSKNAKQLIGNLGIMVKPGLILPSERMNSICSLTNDGFGSYDDDGNLVLGDNDGKGNGSTHVPPF